MINTRHPVKHLLNNVEKQYLKSNMELKIVLVEDDVRLAQLIQEYLSNHGLEVFVENRGDFAVQRILNVKPDMVILDLMLPGKDGLQICRELRPVYHNPIIMLTARDEDMDQVLGLEMGADDYITKPVQPRVLLARLRALNRRVESQLHEQKGSAPSKLVFGELVIDTAAREVRLKNAAVDLTNNEYELCYLLALHAGEVLNREKILSLTRGIEYDGLDRSVDVRISRLRKKLGDDTEKPFRIKTVWGRGYLFVADAWNG